MALVSALLGSSEHECIWVGWLVHLILYYISANGFSWPQVTAKAATVCEGNRWLLLGAKAVAAELLCKSQHGALIAEEPDLMRDPNGQREVHGCNMGMADSEQGWENKGFRAGFDAFPWGCCLCCGVCAEQHLQLSLCIYPNSPQLGPCGAGR